MAYFKFRKNFGEADSPLTPRADGRYVCGAGKGPGQRLSRESNGLAAPARDHGEDIRPRQDAGAAPQAQRGRDERGGTIRLSAQRSESLLWSGQVWRALRNEKPRQTRRSFSQSLKVRLNRLRELPPGTPEQHPNLASVLFSTGIPKQTSPGSRIVDRVPWGVAPGGFMGIYLWKGTGAGV